MKLIEAAKKLGTHFSVLGEIRLHQRILMGEGFKYCPYQYDQKKRPLIDFVLVDSRSHYDFILPAGVGMLMIGDHELKTPQNSKEVIYLVDGEIVTNFPERLSNKLYESEKVHKLLGEPEDCYYISARRGPDVDNTDFVHRPLIHILSDIKSSCASNIIFDDSHEPLSLSVLVKIHRLIRALPNKKYYLLTGSYNTIDTYNEFCSDKQITPALGIISVALFDYLSKDEFKYQHSTIEQIHESVEKEVLQKKTKKLLCLNRSPRLHRVDLFLKMHEQGLVDDNYYSFNCLDDPDAHKAVKITGREFPLRLELRNDKNAAKIKIDLNEFYRTSLFSVITDTVFYDTYHQCSLPFVSEKPFKTMMYGHPFVYVGPAHTLELLKKLGYKTFHPFINESYDRVEDHTWRMKFIVQEINRLCAMNKQETKEFYKNIIPIVSHNLAHTKIKKDPSCYISHNPLFKTRS